MTIFAGFLFYERDGVGSYPDDPWNKPWQSRKESLQQYRQVREAGLKSRVK
jgi:hypothetical protein